MDKNTYPKYHRSALLKIARIELLITAMWKNGRKKNLSGSSMVFQEQEV